MYYHYVYLYVNKEGVYSFSKNSHKWRWDFVDKWFIPYGWCGDIGNKIRALNSVGATTKVTSFNAAEEYIKHYILTNTPVQERGYMKNFNLDSIREIITCGDVASGIEWLEEFGSIKDTDEVSVDTVDKYKKIQESIPSAFFSELIANRHYYRLQYRSVEGVRLSPRKERRGSGMFDPLFDVCHRRPMFDNGFPYIFELEHKLAFDKVIAITSEKIEADGDFK